MQLRVPKKYQARAKRRRVLFKRRSFWLLIFTLVVVGFGYMVMQNPLPYRDGASNFAANVGNEIKAAQAQMFPVEPTATPDVRQDIAECENAYLLGDMQNVVTICSRALVGRPNDVGLHYRVAYALVVTSSLGENKTRLYEAIDMADQTILANPESPLGWTVKAMALDWDRQHAMALTYVQRALELDPNLIIAKAHLANIYRNLGRVELARPLLNEVLEDVQTQPVSNETRAQVYRNYGRFLANVDADFSSALEYMQTARQAMPGHTYIAIEMAGLYGLLDQPDEQTDLLEDSLLVNPRDIALLSNLGDAYYNQGNIPEATEMYTRCLDVDPNYVDCLSPLGRIQYLSNNNYDEAERLLTLATSLGSEEPYDWYLLGRSYYRQQQCQLASAPLRRGYELIQETDSFFVTSENFVLAFSECGLPPP